jgi:hypothetical protein
MSKWNLGWLGLAPRKWNRAAKDFWTGSDDVRENVSTLRPEQEPNFQNLQNAAQGRGAGGASGEVADYYRNNLSDNPADFNAFAAPQLRQYNEDIVPGISEQFASMGAGGLSSSGFRNAQMQGATDLSERLGAIRAGLRQNSAQGLQNITEQALQPYSQNMVTQEGSTGLLEHAASALPSAAAAYMGVPPIPKGMAGQPGAPGTKPIGAKSGPYGSLGMQGAPGMQGPMSGTQGLRASPRI